MYDIFLTLMQEKGVRPKDVARATGVAYTSLTDWKAGRSKPKVDKMQMLADYFGVPLEYLMTGKRSEAVNPPDIRFIADAWRVFNDDDKKEIMTLIQAKLEKYAPFKKQA